MAKKHEHNNSYEKAISLFCAFAQKHGLSFVEEKNDDGDVFLVFPEQENLGFKLTLGVQNGDEANIGMENFWSYIFPFPDNVRFLNKTLEGLVKGTHCLAEFKQFNKVTKTCLLNEKDEIVYTDIKRLKLPFFREKITNRISNQMERTQ